MSPVPFVLFFVAPHAETRARAGLVGAERFVEVHVDAPMEFCRKNDPAGLYGKADVGEIKNFPGVTAPYEAPDNPDIRFSTHEQPATNASSSSSALIDQGFHKSRNLACLRNFIS